MKFKAPTSVCFISLPGEGPSPPFWLLDSLLRVLFSTLHCMESLPFSEDCVAICADSIWRTLNSLSCVEYCECQLLGSHHHPHPHQQQQFSVLGSP